jgi:hypothetical protein
MNGQKGRENVYLLIKRDIDWQFHAIKTANTENQAIDWCITNKQKYPNHGFGYIKVT